MGLTVAKYYVTVKSPRLIFRNTGSWMETKEDYVKSRVQCVHERFFKTTTTTLPFLSPHTRLGDITKAPPCLTKTTPTHLIFSNIGFCCPWWASGQLYHKNQLTKPVSLILIYFIFLCFSLWGNYELCPQKEHVQLRRTDGRPSRKTLDWGP